MDNFSAWVREKLIEEAGKDFRGNPLERKYEYECPQCHKNKAFPSQDMAWRCNMCDVALDFVSVSV